jgi:hypothetical protein
MIRFAGTFLALAILVAGSSAAAQHTLEIIEENGPPANRIDLVVMGDGYPADQQEKLVTNTDSALEHVIAKQVFTGYRSFFNIVRIATVSNEAGADQPFENEYVDTFFDCSFDCSFDCYGIEHLICCDEATVLSVAAEVYPEFDVILMVVNEHEYGGSGGVVAITSASIWAQDIPPHEFGHTIGALGDEYDDPYPSWECQDIYPNVSPTYEPDELKWSYWVEEETPLPTPDSAATGDLEPVGAYEGACYEPTDWYRPVWSCLMRDLDSDFCPVCAEAMVLAFYGFVEPVDSYVPTDETITVDYHGAVDFWIEAVAPEPDTLEYVWTVDGAELATTADGAYLLEVDLIDVGEHLVEVTVRDVSEMIRHDPEGLTEQTISWYLTRLPDTGEGPDGSPGQTNAFEAVSPGGCACAKTGEFTGRYASLIELLLRLCFV